ncbi:MAG TPA: alpha/beta hydrolase [Candidatus Binataceae bacterium]|nr:alpha/beta hydrolase [Candidatus Binataceae bacterium]
MASQDQKQETVRIAGTDLALIKGGSGAPLLVLHDELGYAGWLNWQRELAKDRTLIIPMAPGFGPTPRIPWIDNVRDLACFYARFMREQGLDRADVIGFSFGGWVAAEMIANNPAQFRRSVLVAPGGIKPFEGEIMDLFQVPADKYLRATVNNPAATPEFGILYGGESTPEQYEAWEDARAEFSRIAWQPYFHTPSLQYLLEGAGKVESLIVWGRQDKVVPQAAVTAYNKALNGSKLVTLDNCGHRPEIEQTDRFVDEVKKFLA